MATGTSCRGDRAVCYFDLMLDHPKATVAVIANALGSPELGQVDCVVGIGLSGTMPLILVKEATGLPIMALRKEGVESHEDSGGEAHRPRVYSSSARYVILDDFTVSGKTVRGVIGRMKEIRPGWTCAGAVFYQQPRPSRLYPPLKLVELALRCEVEDVVSLLEEGEELPCW